MIQLTMIADNRAQVAVLSNPTATPEAVAAASQALAATNPAEVEKTIKSLGPLQVEYNGKLYGDGKTITISNGDTESTLGFLLKNIVEGETLSWEIKNKGSVLHNYTANPIGLIWPDNTNSVTIEAKAGTRTIKLELSKKTFTYTDLVATDKSHGGRKALASKNETLYIVRSPLTTRTVNYKMTTNGQKGEFPDKEPLWSTTLPKNGLYEGEVFNSLGGAITGETRHSSEAKGKTFATAVGKMHEVKVEIVDQSRKSIDFMPPGISHLVTSTYNGTKNGLEQVQRTVKNIVSGFPDLEIKPLKIKGESYNEEVTENRHYVEVVDGSISGGLEISSDRKVFAPPIIKPLNIDGVSKVGMYIKPSLDIPISGGIETKKIHETGKYQINKPFYVSVGAKGCLEAGVVAELLAAKTMVDFEVRGYGKGCLGGGWKFQNNNTKDPIFKIELDPVVVGISAKIVSKGYIKFTLVDTAYEYALTKPYQIYPRD